MPIYGLHTGISEPAVWYFSEEKFHAGEYVFVETAHGPTVSKISSGPITALPGFNSSDLPNIIRKATEADLAIYDENLAMGEQARKFCRERIKIRKLDMKLVNVEVFYDKSKLIFYFTAPGRIDFRELVKDLVAEYRARIELRQIGVRHETQITGAIGNCGQMCCCKRYLRQFAPVTIRMAKDQKLFLNPSKISGMCGRLLCCLSYEQDTYEKFHKDAPRAGRKYMTDMGPVKVTRSDMFREMIHLLTESNEEKAIPLSDWRNLHPQRIGNDAPDMEEQQQTQTCS